jgi:DNA-binding LacI/PurR family transcriptional regulator
MTDSPAVSALAVASVTAAAMTVATPMVLAYAKAHGVEFSSPEQVQAVGVLVGAGFGAATQLFAAVGKSLVDAVVAVNEAVANRAMQALALVGGKKPEADIAVLGQKS